MGSVLPTHPTVRRELRSGDLGAIVSHHGQMYAREYGVDQTFEAHVGAAVGEAGKRGWPRANEGVWIVEHDGRHAGSVALTDEGDGSAAVRWVALDAELRGQGLGRRLIGEVVAKAREEDYDLLVLETFSELRAAAHIYRSQGFELQWSETGPRWGRAEITYQRYELALRAAVNPDPAGLRVGQPGG
jgi:ribosomal protein S18 acetylase RimI-like enzyme